MQKVFKLCKYGRVSNMILVLYFRHVWTLHLKYGHKICVCFYFVLFIWVKSFFNESPFAPGQEDTVIIY